MENLEFFECFEEVEDEGQERIGSRWVLTKKKKDGQKKPVKARLVVRGFQETDKPQADAPTVHRETNKVFLAMAANQGVALMSMDMRAAFLQANNLDREVYVQPPADIHKENPKLLWKLVKPLYGLDDASRKFWLKLKEVLNEADLKTVVGDQAFYYVHDGEKLRGMACSHVDDINITGDKDFLSWLKMYMKEKLHISKIEDNVFRFYGVDYIKNK